MKRYENNIVLEECVECDDSLWVFIRNHNALCTLDQEKEKIIYVASIPNEEFYKERLVSKIVPYSNDLILLPMCARNINIYHIKTNTWDQIEIPDTIYDYEPNYKFMEAVKNGRYLYLIGCSYPGVIQFDLVTYKIVKMVECYVGFSKKVKNYIWVRSSCVKIGSKLYLASCVSNEVMIFCLDSLSYSVVEVGNENNRYSGLALDNQGIFWLSPLIDTNVVKWDGRNKYTEIPIDNQSNQGFFSGIVIYDRIKIFPRVYAGCTIIVDEKENISKLNSLYHIYKKLNSDKSIYEDFYGECCFVEKGKVVNRICGLQFENSAKILGFVKEKIQLYKTVIHEDGILFNIENYIHSIIDLEEQKERNKHTQFTTIGSGVCSFLR